MEINIVCSGGIIFSGYINYIIILIFYICIIVSILRTIRSDLCRLSRHLIHHSLHHTLDGFFAIARVIHDNPIREGQIVQGVCLILQMRHIKAEFTQCFFGCIYLYIAFVAITGNLEISSIIRADNRCPGSIVIFTRLDIRISMQASGSKVCFHVAFHCQRICYDTVLQCISESVLISPRFSRLYGCRTSL